MATVSTIEDKAEAAWVAALEGSADITADVVRFGQAGADAVYPCVVVDAGSVANPAEFQNIGVDVILVELQAQTYKDDDTTGSVVLELIGAVRDVFRDDSILSTLSGISNFTVKGIEQDGDVVRVDTDALRVRSLTAKITAIATD
jgi:hypothetical protein